MIILRYCLPDVKASMIERDSNSETSRLEKFYEYVNAGRPPREA